ncbi:MAG: LuxR family transcriptional regulator [Rhodocyclales bacterium]|nr:LuxR family transcriptional regulator [Rhodocyclales bacterium]
MVLDSTLDLQRSQAFLLDARGTERGFFDGAVLGARGLGFEYIAYLIGVPDVEFGWRFVMTGNLPRVWQERYVRRAYHVIDPTVHYAMRAATPMAWTRDLFAGEMLNALARDTLAIGFNHGWTQPLHDSSGAFAVLTLARRGGHLCASELKSKQPMMQWLARVVHQRLFGEFQAWQRNAAIGRLTERELMCLRLAAEGATAADISDTSGVGERTVNFHMANAISKLGAANKTHAVVLAMRLGLLD